MQRTKDISIIVKEQIIDTLDLSVRIVDIITQNAVGGEFKLCDAKWLRVGLTIDFNGEFYSVLQVVGNTVTLNKIVSSSNNLTKWMYGNIQAPFFVAGSKTIAEQKWNELQEYNQSTLLPLIWLPEKITERVYDLDSQNLLDAELRLFLLDSIDVLNTNNEQKRLQAVSPMLRLCDAIDEAIYKSRVIELNGVSTRQTLTQFATMKEGDWEEFIWDANLGGIDYRPTITVKKSNKCCI